jgi:drug/metabolite transporter (DMT)-like permease
MLAIAAVWGACFALIRLGLRDATVLWFSSMRALIAGAALVAVAVAQRRPMPRGVRTWCLIVLLGITNTSIAFAAMFAGVDGLATGSAAVLANAQPLLILLPAWLLYREPVTAGTAIGLAVGFGGLLIVALPGGGGTGAWLSLLAATAITAGTLLSCQLEQADLIQVAGWHFVIGGLVLAGVAGAVEGIPAIEWTVRFSLVLGFLALIGTAVAFLAWFTEVRRSPLGQVAAWTFFVPVFGVAFGLLIVGERPRGWTLVGLSLVLVSMWVVIHAPLPSGAQVDPVE